MQYDKNNIFARIIRGEAPSKKVYEDEKLLAFYDIAPAAPVHCIVIPKGEYIDYIDFINNATHADIAYFFAKINDVVNLLGLKAEWFRLCINNGENSGQTVFHFHVHILGGKKMKEVF